MMVTNWTFDLQREVGHERDLLADVIDVHPRFDRRLAVRLQYCRWSIRAVIGVAALPMSIWQQQMSNCRPSSAIDLVSPVTACLVEV